MAILTGDGKEFPKELFDRLDARQKEVPNNGGLNLLLGRSKGNPISGKYSGQHLESSPRGDGVMCIVVETERGKTYFGPHETRAVHAQVSNNGGLNTLYLRE